jgi:hypothetical protein
LGVKKTDRIVNAIRQRWVHAQSNRRWKYLSNLVKHQFPLDQEQSPVIFFNASTRLQGVSQNSAYSLLTSLGIRADGVPAIHFVCQQGMTRCVLGSNRDNYEQGPPCAKCIHQSKQLFDAPSTRWFKYEEDSSLLKLLERLPVDSLCKVEYKDKQLGFWALNSLRWVLRRQNLIDDSQTRAFLRSYILSAWSIYRQFEQLVNETSPQAVVIFNGMFYPEAAVRQVCLDKGIRVITHEVGIQPFSAYFTTGEATAYPLDIPESFQLDPKMNARLDEYLSHRFSGNFSMAGIKFWPEIKGLDQQFLERIAKFKKLVPVFTNVIFDTSQIHANTIFKDMFNWLDYLVTVIRENPEILFVIRAHPDESRAGKESRESVADWAVKNTLSKFTNVEFIDSDKFISSYELIERSSFVMVYNSTIGLEATLLGKPVLTAGKARYTQIPTSYYPKNRSDYEKMLLQMIEMDVLPIPQEFTSNARRFLYYQLYLSSLPFSGLIEEDNIWKGYVKLKKVEASDLSKDKSALIKTLVDGILHGSEFINHGQ